MWDDNYCDYCQNYSETIYLDLSTGLWLCSECYFSDDLENELDIEDDFDEE